MRIRKAGATMLALIVAAVILPFIARAEEEQKDKIVVFASQPDPSVVVGITDLEARRIALYQLALETASSTQGAVLAILRQQEAATNVSARVRCFYLVNACAFRGTSSVVNILTGRPEVSVVVDDAPIRAQFSLPDPNQGRPLWHMDKTRAREAWGLGVAGRGITIGSIDTGVLAQHRDLSSKYRGNAFGTEHFRNWFDASGWAMAPNDESGHGTHILGSAVGGVGPGGETTNSDVGVAYESKWIAAKAADSQGIGSTSDALAAMQWVQFPTDASGRVDPNAAPDIVLNAWEAKDVCDPSGAKTYFEIAVSMWRAAGMIPVFQVGTGQVGTDLEEEDLFAEAKIGSPGNLPGVIAVGATDFVDERADFSPEGSACGTPSSVIDKPDLYAPGVAIYSSHTSPAQRLSKNSTGSAAAQVAGAAALMMEAAGGRGALTPDEIEAELATTGKPCSRSSGPCHRIDIFEATESVIVTRTARVEGQTVPGAQVKLRQTGHLDRKITASQNGDFAFPRVRPGSYVLEVSAFGFETRQVSLTLVKDEVRTENVSLTAARTITLSGSITLSPSGDPAPSARVEVFGTSVGVNAGPTGSYSLTLPDPSAVDSASPDEFDFLISFTGNNCSVPRYERVSVPNTATSISLDVQLALKRDAYGYSCEVLPLDWQPGTTPLDAKADDSAIEVRMPFLFPLFQNSVKGSGAKRETTAFEIAYVSPNGYIRFDGTGTEHVNSALPNPAAPNAAVYAFWDDLYMDASSSIWMTADVDSFTVEWRDMTFHAPSSVRLTFSATLFPNGDVELKYLDLSGDGSSGNSATVGVESFDGRAGFTYSYNEPSLHSGQMIYLSRAAQPVDLRGTVTDSALTSILLDDATVRATSAIESRATKTHETGIYFLRLQANSYNLLASAWHYADSGLLSQTLDCGIRLNCLSPFVRRDIGLDRLPGYNVTVHVTEGAEEVAGVPVSLGDPHIPDGVTGPTGFTFTDVPAGVYRPSIGGSMRCRTQLDPNQQLTVTGDTSFNLDVESRRDAFGYRCDDFQPASWLELLPDPADPDGQYALNLLGDQGAAAVELPFQFPFYGDWHQRMWVSIDGHITFGEASYQSHNSALPEAQAPNAAIYPFWDDLVMVQGSQIVVRIENAWVAVEWKNLAFFSDLNTRVTFEAILYDNGNVDFQYNSEAVGPASGSSATIGVENHQGTIALMYSHNEAVVSPGLKIQIINPANEGGGGITTGVRGTVFDASNPHPNTGVEPGLPNVDIVLGNGVVTGTTTTNLDGSYRVFVPAGTGYRLFASKAGYRTVVHPTLITVPSTGLLTIDLHMFALPLHTISGRIHDQRGPVYGIGLFRFFIRCLDTYTDPQCYDAESNIKDIPVLTTRLGDYDLVLSDGNYELVIPGSGRCQEPSVTPFVLSDSNRNPRVNISVTLPRDSFGYTCIETELLPNNGLVPVTTLVSLNPIPLPFEIEMYGKKYRVIQVNEVNGTIRLGDPDSLVSALPTGPTIDVFKDEFNTLLDPAGGVFAAVYIDAVVLEWRNVLITGTQERTSFTVILRSNGEIQMEYHPGESPTDREAGSRARIGISDCTGAVSLTYASNSGTAVVYDGLTLMISPRFESIAPSTC